MEGERGRVEIFSNSPQTAVLPHEVVDNLIIFSYVHVYILVQVDGH